MPDLRQNIQSALQAFSTQPLRAASLALLDTLGYQSDRTILLDGSRPQAFLDLANNSGAKFDAEKALLPEWKSADILFQLTDDDLASTSSLFKETDVKAGLLRSYLFFAIELKGSDYPRGKLSAIARQINRVFPMPVMVFLKHGEKLSIAVINRRQNKVHSDKDVLEKVTLIRDIALASPHRGHLDILHSIVFSELEHPKKQPITDFDTLHAAWEQIFNIELLNNRFYKELSNWYFWALRQVDFPDDLEKDDEKRRATGLIRLLTRLIFCWFLKEKDGLIPEKLFDQHALAKLLKGFDPESETSSTYYQAILQNLFFATLNQRMGKDGKGNPYRVFAKDEGFQKNRATYDVNNLYRYEKLFAVPEDEALALFADIPFLNGGLFECLDRTEDGTDKKRYLDGFSRNPKKRPHVPDRLFFDSGETADLSEVYGDKKRKAEKVTGLISILNRYKFTIVENTPIDQEIALDPELLGKVFENLLASYNEETKTTARKQTGSFYTPRPIVDYMVDESLKAHLSRCLTEKAGMKEDDAKAGLDLLFTYTEKEHPFADNEVAALITAIDEVKILDPACGSGAFPMGVLHKLVYILGKLDPDNERWKQTQLAKLDSAPMREALEAAFEDNNDDYGRKLYLIENCLYGVDIQPIAIQITKLRFFISLVCDQKTNRNKKENHGIRPLPNLETKFVAANTLISLPLQDFDKRDFFYEANVRPIEDEVEAAYHGHFSIQRRDQKLALQRKIKGLRQKLTDTMLDGLGAKEGSEIAKKAQHLAEWDPFDPQSTANFFDPHWMFGHSLKQGFDIVIGNPPYGASLSSDQIEYFKSNYKIKTTETAILFIERALNLTKHKGYHTYIIPKSFTFASNYQTTRELILEEINCLVDCGKAFENVKIEACVIGVAKGISTQEYLSLKYEDNYSFSLLSKIHKSLVTKFGFMPNGLNAKEITLGNRLRDSSILLGEISNNSRGEILQKELKNSGTYKFIGGKEIDRYGIRAIKGYLNDKSLITEKAKILPSSIIAQNIVAHVTKPHDHIKIIACLPNTTEILIVDTINQITLRSPAYQCEFIWCVLSSKLINWYCYLFILAKAIRTIHFDNSFTSRIPIPNLSPEAQLPYIQIAQEIYRLKATNSNANVSHLEIELDSLFYKCYELTPEEIAIVEGNAP